jgi:hypothetical protein
MVASVDNLDNQEAQTYDKKEANLKVAEMRTGQVSFKNTAITGSDLDDSIQLLYRYRDGLEIKLTDLDASDLFKIDKDDALPVMDRG